MDFVIRKDRPIPDEKARKSNKSGYTVKFPFKDMEVGDSVDVDTLYYSRINSAIYKLGQDTDMRFVR